MKRYLIVVCLLITCQLSIYAQTSHVVQRGETIESIANKYGLTLEQIKAANPNLGILYAGVKLAIPNREDEGKKKDVSITAKATQANPETKGLPQLGDEQDLVMEGYKSRENGGELETGNSTDAVGITTSKNKGNSMNLQQKNAKNELTEEELLTKADRKERRKEKWKKTGKIIGGVAAALGAVAMGVLAYESVKNESSYGGVDGNVVPYGGTGGYNNSNESDESSDGKSSLPTYKCTMCNGKGKVFNPSQTMRTTHNMYHMEQGWTATVNNCDICGGSHCARCNTSSCHKKCPKCQGKGTTSY